MSAELAGEVLDALDVLGLLEVAPGRGAISRRTVTQLAGAAAASVGIWSLAAPLPAAAASAEPPLWS